MATTQDHGLRRYGPGKFGYVVDAIIYQVSLDGPDEQHGDVSEDGYCSLLMRGPIRDGDYDPSDFASSMPLTEGEKAYLSAPGGFILTENSDGFVHVDAYATTEELEDAWQAVTR